MIRGNHRSREALNQLKIPLLTGDDQKPVQWKRPTQGEKTDGFTAGCPKRKHIQEPMAAKVGTGCLMLLPETLTDQRKHGRSWLPEEVTDLERALIARGLQRDVIP
jgi:hypothetical protein